MKYILILNFVWVLMFSSCRRNDNAQSKNEQRQEKVEDKAEDVGEEVEDEAEDVGDEVEDVVD